MYTRFIKEVEQKMLMHLNKEQMCLLHETLIAAQAVLSDEYVVIADSNDDYIKAFLSFNNLITFFLSSTLSLNKNITSVNGLGFSIYFKGFFFLF